MQKDNNKYKIHIDNISYSQDPEVKAKLLTATSSPEALDKYNSVWVSASAGSGKTYILISRVLNLLLTGVHPDKILCITYTNAGASEMNSRILETLKSWATDNEDKIISELKQRIFTEEKINENIIKEKYLTSARNLFNKVLETKSGIKIQTIHSFCQSILKKFPLEAGLTPNFSVMNTRDEKDLLQEAYQQVFNELYENKKYENFKFITKHTSFNVFEDLKKEIISSKNKYQEFFNEFKNKEDKEIELFFQEKILKDILYKKESDYIQNNYFFKKENNRHLKEIENDIEFALQKEAKASGLNHKKLLFSINEFRQKLNSNNYIEKLETLLTLFNEFTTEDKELKQLALKKYLNNESSGIAKKLPLIWKRLKSLSEEVFKVSTDIFTIQDYQYTTAINKFALSLIKKYEMLKNRQALLDYNDLLDKAKKLFNHEEFAPYILYKLDEKISHLLIDESQDTSPIQWNIIDAISKEFFSQAMTEFESKSLFIVGDQKQSILSFQGTNIETQKHFRQKLETRVRTQHQDDKWIDLPKFVSFRTSVPIIDFVSEMFKSTEAKNGVIDNSSKEDYKHYSFKNQNEGLVEIYPPIKIKKEDNSSNKDLWKTANDNEEKMNIKSILAKQISLKIKTLLSEKSENKNRTFTANDIMVLVETRTSFIPKLINELAKLKIKVAGSDRFEIDKNIAFKDFISLLKFLTLKYNDIYLANVLKSPIFNFSEEQLFLACNKDKETTLLENIIHLSKDNNIFSKCIYILNKLDEMLKTNPTPYEFFSYLLRINNIEESYKKRLGTEFDVFKNQFFNICIEYETSKNHSLGIIGFFKWAEIGQESIKQEGIDKKDGVKIITCHGSKGLESPIVIIPMVPKYSNNKGKIHWQKHNDFLPSTPLIKHPFSIIPCNEILQTKENKKEQENLERNRLLYVASTRAEERLYIFGTETKEKNNWYDYCIQTFQTFEKKGLVNNHTDSITEKFKEIYEETNSNIKTIYCPNIERNKSYKTPSLKEKEIITIPIWIKNLDKQDLDKTESQELKNKFSNDKTEKGLIIHKLFEYLPNLQKKDISLAKKQIESFLSKSNILSKEEIDKYIENTIKIMQNKKFNFIFENQWIKNESEISFKNKNGKNETIRIDALIKDNNTIYIIDYKSSENQSNISSHKKQVSFYKNIVKKLYPDTNIKTCILYTENLELIFT